MNQSTPIKNGSIVTIAGRDWTITDQNKIWLSARSGVDTRSLHREQLAKAINDGAVKLRVQP